MTGERGIPDEFSWVRGSVGPGGGKKIRDRKFVSDNGEESNKRMKWMLRTIKIAIAVAVPGHCGL